MRTIKDPKCRPDVLKKRASLEVSQEVPNTDGTTPKKRKPPRQRNQTPENSKDDSFEIPAVGNNHAEVLSERGRAIGDNDKIEKLNNQTPPKKKKNCQKSKKAQDLDDSLETGSLPGSVADNQSDILSEKGSEVGDGDKSSTRSRSRGRKGKKKGESLNDSFDGASHNDSFSDILSEKSSTIGDEDHLQDKSLNRITPPKKRKIISSPKGRDSDPPAEVNGNISGDSGHLGKESQVRLSKKSKPIPNKAKPKKTAKKAATEKTKPAVVNNESKVEDDAKSPEKDEKTKKLKKGSVKKAKGKKELQSEEQQEEKDVEMNGEGPEKVQINSNLETEKLVQTKRIPKKNKKYADKENGEAIDQADKNNLVKKKRKLKSDESTNDDTKDGNKNNEEFAKDEPQPSKPKKAKKVTKPKAGNLKSVEEGKKKSPPKVKKSSKSSKAELKEKEQKPESSSQDLKSSSQDLKSSSQDLKVENEDLADKEAGSPQKNSQENEEQKKDLNKLEPVDVTQSKEIDRKTEVKVEDGESEDKEREENCKLDSSFSSIDNEDENEEEDDHVEENKDNIRKTLSPDVSDANAGSGKLITDQIGSADEDSKFVITCECGHKSRSKGGHTRHLRKCQPQKFNLDDEIPNKPTKIHKCEQCDYSAPRRVLVINHMKVHAIFQCKRCKFRAETDPELDEHLQTEHKDRSECKFCKVCNRYVKCNEIPLEKHMEECGGRVPFKCPECDKEFQYESSLKCHVVSHYPDKPKLFACTECDYKSNYKANLKKHVRHIHQMNKERNIKCSECDKMFFTEDNMRRHLKLHSDERPYKCDQCIKAFKTIHGLKCHVISHQEERPFKCDIEGCNKDFKFRKLLRVHVAEFHKEATKSFFCSVPECALSFYKKCHLDRHETTHTDQRKYLCNWKNCEKTFRHADNLKIHHLIHTDEKPIKCEHCDFTCRQKTSIHWHLSKTHPEQFAKLDPADVLNLKELVFNEEEVPNCLLTSEGQSSEINSKEGQSTSSSSSPPAKPVKKDLYEFKSDAESEEDEMKPGLLRKEIDKDKPPLPPVDNHHPLLPLSDSDDKDDKDKNKEDKKPKKKVKKKKKPPDTKVDEVKDNETPVETIKTPCETVKLKKRGRKKMEQDIKNEEQELKEVVEKKRAAKGKKAALKKDKKESEKTEEVAPPKKKRGPKKKTEKDSPPPPKPKKVTKGRKKKKQDEEDKEKNDENDANGHNSDTDKYEGSGAEDKSLTKVSSSKSIDETIAEVARLAVGDEEEQDEKEEKVEEEKNAKEDEDTKEENDTEVMEVEEKDVPEEPKEGKSEEEEVENDRIENVEAKAEEEENIENIENIGPEESIPEETNLASVKNDKEEKEEDVESDRFSSDLDTDFEEELKPPPAPRPPPIYDSEDGDIESGPENEDFNNSTFSNEPLRDFESSREISRDFESSREMDNVGSVKRDFESSREENLGSVKRDFESSREENLGSVKRDFESSREDNVGSVRSVRSVRRDFESSREDNVETVARRDFESSREDNVGVIRRDFESSRDENIGSVKRDFESSHEENVYTNKYSDPRSQETDKEIEPTSNQYNESLKKKEDEVQDLSLPNPVNETPPPGDNLKSSQANEDTESSMPEVDKDYVGRYFEEIQSVPSLRQNDDAISGMNSLEDSSAKPSDAIEDSVPREHDSGVPSSLTSSQTENSLQMQTPPTADMSHKRMEILASDRQHEEHYQPRADNLSRSSTERLPSGSTMYDSFTPAPIDPFISSSRESSLLRQNDPLLVPTSASNSFMRFPESESMLQRQRMATPYDRNFQGLHRLPESALPQPNSASPLLRRSNAMSREEAFPGAAQTMSRNPFHTSWSGQDVRPPHWGHPTYIQRPLEQQAGTSPSLFPKDSYLSSRDFMFDPSRGVAERNMFSSLSSPQTQQTDLPHDTFQLDRFGLGSYFSSHGYSASPSLPVDYTRTAHSSTQKTLDDRYRQTTPGMSDFRTLPQSSSTEMFGSINMNSSFNLDKYMYHRDPVYHSQHMTDNTNSAFLTHGVPPQHAMFGRDYPHRTFYTQNTPYSFVNMNEKQYAAAAASAKLTHTPVTGSSSERDFVPRPNTAAPESQIQDPYRHHTMLYNMMNRYFE